MPRRGSRKKEQSGVGLSPVEALTLPHSAVVAALRRDGTSVLIRSLDDNPNLVSTFPPGPRPARADTPYRSKFYVNKSSSSDGNAYSPGDPIWELEALRQGIMTPNAGEFPSEDPAPVMAVCPKCKGRKTYWGRDRGGNLHKEGCTCSVCTRPCKYCEGTGETLRATGGN